MWLRGLILKRANSPPRITARRGGGVTKKMARSLLMDAAGVVFLVPSIGTPPRPREKRMLRNIFLIGRPPPPRGDARRGIRSFQNEPPNHISLSRPRWTRVSTTSATLSVPMLD